MTAALQKVERNGYMGVFALANGNYHVAREYAMGLWHVMATCATHEEAIALRDDLALLHRMADELDSYEGDGRRSFKTCRYCKGSSLTFTEGPIRHADDCLVMEADRLLSRWRLG